MKSIANINPSFVFQETLRNESGKEETDLRLAYAENMAKRIQDQMLKIDIEKINFDDFFDCAVSAMKPVQLEIDDKKWFAAAINIPEMVEKACERMDENEKSVICRQCLEASAFGQSFENDNYKCSNIESKPAPENNKTFKAIKKIFATAAFATALFLAPIESDAKLLGTVPAFITQQSIQFQDKLLRGQNDQAYMMNNQMKRVLEGLKRRKKHYFAMLEDVNSFWNKFKYVEDQKNYNEKEHWATTSEFLAKMGGDCEDFALVKYWTLRELGVPAENMNVLVGFRTDRDEAHAVLSVKDENGKVWIMDNLEKKLVSEEQMYSVFVPKFQVSEQSKQVCLITKELQADLNNIGYNLFKEQESAPAMGMK